MMISNLDGSGVANEGSSHLETPFVRFRQIVTIIRFGCWMLVSMIWVKWALWYLVSQTKYCNWMSCWCWWWWWWRWWWWWWWWLGTWEGCRRRQSWHCWGSTRRSNCCSCSGCWASARRPDQRGGWEREKRKDSLDLVSFHLFHGHASTEHSSNSEVTPVSGIECV